MRARELKAVVHLHHVLPTQTGGVTISNLEGERSMFILGVCVCLLDIIGVRELIGT